MRVSVPALRSPASRPARLRAALAVCLAAATSMLAVPGPATAATAVCSNKTGTNSGYYYQMWTAGTGSACITLSAANAYSTSWSGVGDFVAGVGWNPGSSHTVTFSSSFTASKGTAYLSLYGWTTSPLIEYYITEDWYGSAPAPGTYKGEFTSDGGTYKLYENERVNAPSIEGTQTFEQYWAVRTSPVTSGTITTANYFNAWAAHGMYLGTYNYQILATEAFSSGSGSSTVTVK